MWGSVTRNLDKEMRYVERAMSAAVRSTEELNCKTSERLAFLFLSAWLSCCTGRRAGALFPYRALLARREWELGIGI